MQADLASAWLPLGFGEWPTALQAAALGVLTFVQEDAPTVAAAFLASAGSIGWAAGFFGCAIGIWVGDALLYCIARVFGRRLFRWSWFRKALPEASVARAEEWFRRRGIWLLFSSRFVPGTRLPSYVAAGFLRLPFGRFLAITGLAVLLWTTTIFFLAYAFGGSINELLPGWSGYVLLIAAGFVAAVLMLRNGFSRRARTWLGRWMRWEFWPAWLFYLPVVVNYLWLSLRYRGLMVPTAANPAMFSGGIVGESKSQIQARLFAACPEFTARAFLIAPGSELDRIERINDLLQSGEIAFPFIIKPEVGQRGAGVKLIHSVEQAGDYFRQTSAPLIAQEYAEGPNEAGVFYYRFPHESRGRIFAITEKIFPTVRGDGESTVAQLIWRDPRARFMAGVYLARLGRRAAEVPARGASIKLVEAGNHAQGCIFLDGWRLRSPELEARIDAISRKIDGFYIGRYDVRYRCEEQFRRGEGFKIVELNGAASEATSIYDARHSLIDAYRVLFRQWALVFAIGAANRARGIAGCGAGELIRAWLAYRRAAVAYPIAD